jgi:hypothetical protein
VGGCAEFDQQNQVVTAEHASIDLVTEVQQAGVEAGWNCCAAIGSSRFAARGQPVVEFISGRTADGHVAHILAKPGLSARAQAAVWAVEHSLAGAPT